MEQRYPRNAANIKSQLLESNSGTSRRNVACKVSAMTPAKNHTYSLQYSFNQTLDAPAEVAFDWCTDYQPSDIAMMKEEGERNIQKITDDTILLTETTKKNNRLVRKTKLVRLNRPFLSWTNTHIAGPNRHSQFLYKIVPEGKTRCRLYFQGLLIQYSRKPLTPRQLHNIARNERQGDATAWRHLAASLRKETASR